MQQPGLLPGVELDLQRVVVLPGDVQPAGLPHDAADAVRLALIARRVVLGQVPGVGDSAAFGGERHAGVVALRRRHHAEAPVFGDERHPIAGADRTRAAAFGRPLRGRCAAANRNGQAAVEATPSDTKLCRDRRRLSP